MTKSSSEAGRVAPCGECGMPCKDGEYHPFAACLMFKACHNSETVRANLEAVRPVAPPPAAGVEVERIFRDLMKKVTPRPFNEKGEKDGCFNYIHQEDVGQAYIEIKKALSAAPPPLTAGTAPDAWRADVETLRAGPLRKSPGAPDLKEWDDWAGAVYAVADRLAVHLEEAHAREGRAYGEVARLAMEVAQLRSKVEKAKDGLDYALNRLHPKWDGETLPDNRLGRARAALAPTTTTGGKA